MRERYKVSSLFAVFERMNINMGKNKKKTMDKITGFIKSRQFGIVLSAIQSVLTIILLSIILYLNMLPVKFFIPVCFVVLFLCGFAFILAFTKKLKPVGKLISLFMVVVSSMGLYYASYLSGTIDNISGANTNTHEVNVYVMKADKADDIADAKDYTFGIMAVLDRDNTDKAIREIESTLGQKIETMEYEGYVQLAQALYDDDVDAIILNSAYVTNLIEDDEYASFSSLTKVLLKTTHQTQIDVDTNKDVTDRVFTMYLSGIDVEGKISTTSRSDVNIIAVVNPKTHQVLLINTPRDYYVPLSISKGVKDKLTHAGIYGVDVSMDTLGMIYDIDLEYYFRINFTGFKDMVDALGGIRVYVDRSFIAWTNKEQYTKGYMDMNGYMALGFVRERKAYPDGDNQRGRNQMAVIQQIVDKASSPAILNDFSGLMDSLEGSFETSLSSSQISSLVRMQLDEGGSWTILSYGVTGESARKPVYSMSTEQSVMIPDMDTVEKAKKLMHMVYDGKILTQEYIDNLPVGEDDNLDSTLNDED